MIKANVLDSIFEIIFNREKSEGTVNQTSFSWDVKHQGNGVYHVLYKQKTYTLILESGEAETGIYKVQLNGKPLEIGTFDRIQLLLKSMGMDTAMGKKINEIKAPMPGLVLRIPINEGDSVSKGEGLLVLEAMKMENSIKAPGDVVVSKIHVKPGQAVEKNQLLVSFA
jgi:biotin carboxyl carrier protein